VENEAAVPVQTRTSETTSAGSEEQLENRLRGMKAEIDGLQIAAAERTRPWFRQASLIISLLALLLSLASTGYTTWRTEQQDVRAARTELGELIQRLSVLPKENLELQTNYANKPAALTQLSGAVNTENLVLARQAADIIERRIPNNVAAIEYYAVASALNLSGDYDTGRRLLERGLERVNDPVSHSAMLRTFASSLYGSGEIAAGRQRMQQARDIFSRYPTKIHSLVVWTNVHTELFWIGLERAAGDCTEARRHLAEADPWASQIAAGPDRDRVQAQLRAQGQALTSCAPGPLPSQPLS
jgi:hypothetical protein